ncbi:DUF5305 family protein [Halobaculum sp. EA56]|uniref:DUF5305 family protein n=1 Tax=Halobaculum sp. EA56 TaxID=3421648 RepID=UPI003EC14ADE
MLYDQGERLENRSVYFLFATPVFSFEVNTTVPAGTPVEVQQRLQFEIVGVRDGAPFYRQTRTLVERNQTVRDGTVTTSSHLNISAVSQELAALLEEVQNTGQFQLRLQLNVTYQTERYQGRLRSTVPFVITGEAYYIDGELSAERTESTTVERQITRQPSPIEYGSIAIIGLLIIGLATVTSRIKKRADTELLKTRIVHDQHEEWISRGQFPTNAEKQYISILTLEDLVDVAIDTNRRVIHDPEIDAYAVIDSTEIYYYALEGIQADDWLDI